MDFENLQKKSVADLRSIAQMMQLEVPERCTKARLIALITGTAEEKPADVASKVPEQESAPKKGRGKKSVVSVKSETTEPAASEQPAEGETSVSETQGEVTETKPEKAEKPRHSKIVSKGKRTVRGKQSRVQPRSESEETPQEAGAQTQEEPLKEQPKEQPKEKKPPEPQGEPVEGLLEVLQDGYGFLRVNMYYPGNKDIYVAPAQIRRFGLKTGDYVKGRSRQQRDNERYQALCFVETVNDLPADESTRRKPFESLVPIYPDERIRLETVQNELSTRMIDLMAPIGKGQRGMIVSPPKAGKTVLLKKIANAITTNYPDIKLIVLLIDERPEEVTDMQESVQGEVVSSTFDELPERHIKVAELVFERSRRLVEMGHDVVILMDSLTRLARAYNITIAPTGRSLSGGLDPGALYNPKRFFGAARNIRGGGSLTIVATALIDTGSKMDDVIFEEFKGTGNMELHLDRKLSEKRVFPAVDINKSGTRKEELLLSEAEMNSVYAIRKAISSMGTADVTEMIVGKMLKCKTNADFIATVKLENGKTS